jgi:hypothetical protein
VAVSEALAVLGELVAPEVSGVQAALAVLEESAARAVLAALAAIGGSTILPTGAARHTGIVLQPTVLAARLVATRCLTVRPVHGIRSGARAAIWAVITAAARGIAEESAVTAAEPAAAMESAETAAAQE